MNKLKKTIMILSVVLIVAISYFVGCFVGFTKGNANAWGAAAPADAASILHVIHRIKNDQRQSALKLLEYKLNAKILEHWILLKIGPSIFDIHSYTGTRLGFEKDSFSLMKKAAQYRINNPTIDKGNKEPDVLDEAVKFYSSYQN